MVQKSSPFINKSGYSMFWNSMWDSKNNFSKNLQKDFFIKNFINSFFSDFSHNQILYNFKNNHQLNNYINLKYNFNLKNKNYLNVFLKNNFTQDLNLSKIWFFKYQKWIIIFFFIFYKNNSYIFKNILIKNSYNLNLFKHINNYNNQYFKKPHLKYFFFKKNNF